MSYRPPTELGNAIEEFFRRFGYEREYLKGKVINEWKDIVGEFVAGKAKITNFDGDVLTIKTESSVWKNEIFLRKGEIIKLINERFKTRLVSEIRIV